MVYTMWTCFSAEGEQSRPRDGGQLPPGDAQLPLERSDPHRPPLQTQGARVSLKNESGQDFQGILETRSVDALK